MEPFAERLPAQDRLFLDLETPHAPQHVAVLCWLDAQPLQDATGALDVAALRARIGARLHLVPRTRQRLAFAPVDHHPHWVDDERFDLALHVLHTALPKPGGERELEKVVARLLAEPLDRSRSLWELWWIEGLSRGRIALLAKLHHCMADGIAGFSWLTALLMGEREDVPLPPAPWQARPAPTRDELLRHEVGRRAEQWLGALQRLPRLLEGREELEQLAANVVRRAGALGETLGAALQPAPHTPFNAPLGPERSFVWRALSMERASALRSALGGTLNELALSCVAGALRALLSADTDVEGLVLRASVPVNRRTPGEPEAKGNRISLCIVDLPVGVADARERHALVREASERAKASEQIAGLELLGELAEWTTSALMGAAARAAMQARPFNLVVTNIPGPPRPVRVFGARLHSLAPAVNLAEGLGLGVALASYAGELSFGCIADPQLVPELAAFADAIVASFEELEKAVAAGDGAPSR
ncbi:MAG TPA: wax ester/triacylglycerol synthase family O-acyltransferase [Myxococcota bacterium]|nr:wax ester/triacylglycerol synthase family O-acyltransferase [Myxococcota bacterium]